MERRKYKIWLPLLLSVSMVVGMFLGYKMRDGMPSRSFFYMEKRRPVQEILDLIQNKYVDDVNINALADTGIIAMLYKLDPHTQFIPARSVEQVNEDIQGSFYGIGIEFKMFDDTLHVINVLKDGPGDKSHLQTGDKFLKAGDSIIAGKKMDAERIRNILKGNKGSLLHLIIMRGNRQINVAIERDVIPVTSIDAAYMMGTDLGYIRLNKFSRQTYREFMESLVKLKKAGMKKLIFDLRGNGGGILDEAVEIADEFLEGDKLITYTEGKHSPRKEYRGRRVGQFEQGELIILADEGTASASEVLIGALQDWDRAVVVGRTTFGKGLVQEQFDLSDNSALRLTISRYYTPLGRSIQRSYANGSRAYYEEVMHRFMPADSLKPDSLALHNVKKFKTKSGKTVYAGGGITPDYVIAADTGSFGRITARIFISGSVNAFGYKYVIDHPSIIKQYPTAAAFEKGFTIDEEAWKYFGALAARDSINIIELAPDEKKFLVKSLKLAIARQIWRNEGYFIVFNQEDEAVKKAVMLSIKP